MAKKGYDRSRAILERIVGTKSKADLADKFKEAFAEKDLDEDVALMNARLAKILTKDYYDHERRVPILWSPETNNNNNNGTGPSNEGTV